MKNRSFFAVGIIILAPAFAAAAQPAQSPPSQSANQTPGATAQPDQRCNEAGKSATAKASSGDVADASTAASDSVKKVQRNTGDHPTRTKTPPSAEETCATQPPQ